jgi:hypothetical protein
MLTTFEVVIYVIVLVLLPLIVYSLITGSRPPEKSWFAKYYRAERYLDLAGNVFVLAICAYAIARLGLHFGYIGPGAEDSLMLWIGLAFAATLLCYLGLWVRAAVRVRRNGRSSA